MRKKIKEAGPIEQDMKGALYVDYDEDSREWAVFGTETGFAYGTFASKDEAKEYARELSSSYGIRVESKRKGKNKQIIDIKEEVKIGDIILEKGDKIEVLPKKAIKESVESDIINSDITIDVAYNMIQFETFDEFYEAFDFLDFEELSNYLGSIKEESQAREIFDWLKENVYIVETSTTQIVDTTEVPISYQYVGFGEEGKQYIVFSTVFGINDMLKFG